MKIFAFAYLQNRKHLINFIDFWKVLTMLIHCTESTLKLSGYMQSFVHEF